jgi:hypothetical protein
VPPEITPLSGCGAQEALGATLAVAESEPLNRTTAALTLAGSMLASPVETTIAVKRIRVLPFSSTFDVAEVLSRCPGLDMIDF